jgi:hypothetical protein
MGAMSLYQAVCKLLSARQVRSVAAELVIQDILEFFWKGIRDRNGLRLYRGDDEARRFCHYHSVDEVNAASLRVLEKLGFERIAALQGAFGNMFLLRLDVGDS